MSEHEVAVGVPPDASNVDIVRSAIEVAVKLQQDIPASDGAPMTVAFYLDGIHVLANPDSDPLLLVRDVRRAYHDYIGALVGPYPSPQLTVGERLSDARTKRRNNLTEIDNEIDAYGTKQWTELKATLDKLPPIQLINDQVTQHRLHDMPPNWYAVAMNRAERWAQVMQYGMAQGQTVAQIAQRAFNYVNITGTNYRSYDYMVQALVKYWKHGAELQKWHDARHV